VICDDGVHCTNDTCNPETGVCVYMPDVTNGVPEACDEVDNDCDGEVDEDFDLASDVANCGACGRACAPTNTRMVSCEAGECMADCAPAFGNCDGDAANGCEASLTSEPYCGGCDPPCPKGTWCPIALALARLYQTRIPEAPASVAAADTCAYDLRRYRAR